MLTGERIRRGDMFRGIFTARCPAQREQDETPLRFHLYERRGNAARGSVRIVKKRISSLEIGESSDDFRINPYYWTVVRFDYEERKRRET